MDYKTIYFLQHNFFLDNSTLTQFMTKGMYSIVSVNFLLQCTSNTVLWSLTHTCIWHSMNGIKSIKWVNFYIVGELRRTILTLLTWSQAATAGGTLAHVIMLTRKHVRVLTRRYGEALKGTCVFDRTRPSYLYLCAVNDI